MDEKKCMMASQPKRPVIVDIQTAWSREVELLQCSFSLSASFLCHATVEFSPGVNVHLDLVPDTAPFQSTFTADEQYGGSLTLFLRAYPGKTWQCVLTVTFSLAEVSFERHELKDVTNIIPLKIVHNGEILHLPANTQVISSVSHLLD